MSPEDDIPLSDVLLDAPPTQSGMPNTPRAPAAQPQEGPPAGEPNPAPTYFDMHRASITPDIQYLRPDEVKIEEKEAYPDSSLMDRISSGLRLHNTVTGLFDIMSDRYDEPVFKETPGHKPDIKGYEEFSDQFVYSVSVDNDEWIKSRIDQEKAWREEAGLAGELIGAISDPIAWFGGAYSLARKTGTLGLIAYETGAVASSEAMLQGMQQARTARESIINIAATGILTSGLGAAGAYMSAAERRVAERELRRALNNEPDVKLDPETGAIVDSVGAARASGTLEENSMTGVGTRSGKWSRKAAELLSIGPGARGLQYSLPEVREMFQRLVDMPFELTKHREGKTLGPSVEASMGHYTKLWNDAYQISKKAFDDYRQAGGEMNWKEFDARVGRAMRRNDIDGEIPQVETAAKAWRKSVNEVRDRAVEVGALGENVVTEYATSYFPRAIDFAAADDIQPLRKAIVDYHMNTKGLDENAAYEVADHLSQRFQAGSTLPPGIIPVPEASGIQARTITINDEFLEPYLNSHASDVLMRHFREMGAEIELRKVFGIDAGPARQWHALNAEYETAKRHHEGVMKRYKARHEDIKELEKRLAVDEAEGSRVAGAYRAYVMPGSKMEMTDLPASAGKAPIVSTRRRKGAVEIDLQLRNPIAVEGLADIQALPAGNGTQKLVRVRTMVDALINERALTRDFGKAMDDLIRALPKTRRALTEEDIAALGPIGELRGRTAWNEKQADALANRITRMMVKSLRDKGHDAISFTAKGRHGTKFILLEPEKAVRAPTSQEKQDMRRSLKRTMESYRKMVQRQEAWDEQEKWYLQQLKKLPKQDRSIHQALNEWLNDIDNKYQKMMDEAPDQKTKDRLKRELRGVHRDTRSLIGRIQGHLGRPADATNAFVRAGRWLRALTATTQLGGVVLTSLPELARPVFQYGLKPYAQGFSTFVGHLARDFKVLLRIDKGAEYSEAIKQVHRMGAGLEVVTQQRLLNWMGEDGMGMLSEAQVAFEKGVGLYTGLSHWTQSVKSFVGILAVDNIARVAGKVANGTATADELSKLARAGISKDAARSMASQFEQFSSKHGPVTLANTDDWADRHLAELLEAAVRSEVNMVALEPGMSDKWLWTSNEVGKIVGQFQSFAQGATNRAMVGGLQRADAAFYQGAVMSAAMGAAVMALKDLSVGRDPTDKHPARVLAESIERSGMLGVWDRAFTMARSLHDSSSAKFWGEQEAVRILGPTLGRTVPNMMTAAGGAATGDPQWDAMADLVPYNDLFHIRRMFERTVLEE